MADDTSWSLPSFPAQPSSLPPGSLVKQKFHKISSRYFQRGLQAKQLGSLLQNELTLSGLPNPA